MDINTDKHTTLFLLCCHCIKLLLLKSCVSNTGVHELKPQYARVMFPKGATIRYLLMFVHRRDLEQSSVSRIPYGRQGVGKQCQISSLHSTLIFEKFRHNSKYKNPVDSLILGVGEPTKNGKEIFGFASPLQTTK